MSARKLIGPNKHPGPVLLGSFPQIMQSRMHQWKNKTQPSSLPIKVEVLNQSYAMWMERIYTQTQAFVQQIHAHQPAQVTIPFDEMYVQLLGVREMAGVSRHIQDSGHPASDLAFRHTKLKFNQSTQMWNAKPVAFLNGENEIKQKVHIAYKRIIGFTFRYLQVEHFAQLEKRMPDLRQKLFLFETLRESIRMSENTQLKQVGPLLVNGSTVNIVSKPPMSQWYTEEHIQSLFNALKTDLGTNSPFAFTTPISDAHADYQATLQTNIVQLLTEYVADTKPGNLRPYWLMIPLNLGGQQRFVATDRAGSHWTLASVYIDLQGKYQVRYFDSLGNPIPESSKAAIRGALTEVFPASQSSIDDCTSGAERLQHDGHNCGPWIIEFARACLDPRLTAKELRKINIEAARQQQQDRLLAMAAPTASSHIAAPSNINATHEE